MRHKARAVQALLRPPVVASWMMPSLCGDAPKHKMNTKEYYKLMEENVFKEFEIAKQARAKGFDFATIPEPYIAKDIADKVEGLVELPGIAPVIRNLQKQYKTEEEVAFKLAEQVIENGLKETNNNREIAGEKAIRAGLAYLTQGAVSAPIEGIAKVKIKKNPDGSEYLSVYYAGPIRAAGGTAEALSIIVADYVRRYLKLGKYQPTPAEIGRCAEEILWYKRNVHLQYMPTQEEIETIVRNVPVCIDGEPTEEFEVVTYRNLGRVETNRVRGGMCLVIAEGIAQKASKLVKKLKPLEQKYNLKWSWLEGLLVKKAAKEIPYAQERLEEIVESAADTKYNWVQNIAEEDVNDVAGLVDVTKEADAFIEDITEEKTVENIGNEKYMQEIPAGRPVFSHPSKKGGFTLRYGRTRTTGYSAVAVNPATMVLLDGFIAIGTQIRLEFPGKAGIVTVCDSINGPTVVLKNGELKQINTLEEAKENKNNLEKIITLGDLLISAGDFIENNHKLFPSSYVEEWWAQEAKKEIGNDSKKHSAYSKYLSKPFVVPDFETAAKISTELNIPLHPQYTFFWNNISIIQLVKLIQILGKLKYKPGMDIPFDKDLKDILELLCVFHSLSNGQIKIDSNHAKALLFSTALDSARPEEILSELKSAKVANIMDAINRIAPVKIKNRAPTYVGARMGRPEKAKPRKMVPPPHSLFPTGVIKGRVRDLIKAANVSPIITPEVSTFFCSACGKNTIFPCCPACGTRTTLLTFCPVCKRKINSPTCPHCNVETKSFERVELKFKEMLDAASAKIGISLPKKLVGVLGMTSKDKVPEPIEKGILRASHNIYAFKDGTVRFDATDAPISHFTPAEIKVPISKIKELGYTNDINGKPIENENQVLELKPQDIIISDWGEEESCSNYLLRTTHFMDDLLEKYYGLPRYYNAKNKHDLVGTSIVALAPHTSTGMVGRILGFTDAKVCFANPAFHAAKRRDCDGDEDSIILLLDTFINFSKCFIPKKRGGRMDAPLVITTILNPLEIDDEVYDVDISSEYPLEFYELTEQGSDPSKIEIKTFEDIVEAEDPFNGWAYTHEVSDINNGVISNTYTEGEMLDKLDKQLALAEKIRAVDARDVAERIINTHFIPDMKGNLRTFSRQKVRCTKCNAKYRRPPLSGVCLRCGGNIVLTVHQGTIIKYLNATKEMATKFNISPYLRQQIEFIEKSIVSIFGREKQQTLGTFK